MSDINEILCGTLSGTNGFLQEAIFFPIWKLGNITGSSSRKSSALVLFEDGDFLYSSGKNIVTGLGWSYDFDAGINNRIHGACYNPIYDSLIVGDEAGTVVSLDRVSGNENWTYDTGSATDSPNDCAVDNDGNVYAACDKGLRKLNGLTGSLIWKRMGIEGKGCDAGLIGSVHGVVVCGPSEAASPSTNLALYDIDGNMIWNKIIPSGEYYPGQKRDLSTCRIYGTSRDILVGGNRHAGFQKSLWRINGGNGSVIWDLDLGATVQWSYIDMTWNPYTSFGKCIDYDDQGYIWCGVDLNSGFRLAKVSPGGSILDTFEIGDAATGDKTPHVTIQVNLLPVGGGTTTSEPTTTTQEPLPCEVSNLFEYGYIKKDGIRILVRKTEGNEIRLIRPIPPEWTIGTQLNIIPGCNKTLCDCSFKWDNINNFLGLGIKMPMDNPLVADSGANPR